MTPLFEPGNTAASKLEGEQAKQESFRLYAEDRDNLTELVLTNYAQDKTKAIRKAIREAVQNWRKSNKQN